MPGLLIARNNAQLFQQESAVEEQSVQRTRLESGLAAHILNAWETNKRAKLDIEQKFLQNLRQRNGIYDSAKLALIKKTQGSEVFMKLTEVKCRAAESWLGDVYSPAYEKDGFTIKPTPEPEMPEYVLERIHSEVLNASYNMALQYIQESGQQISRQEFNIVAQKHFEQLRDYESKMLYKAAEDAAQRMQRRIKDQLHDGGYLKAFEEVRRDIVTFGTGFLKGPVIRKRSVLKWKRTPGGYLPAMSQSLVYEYMRVSPFDIYPSPTAIEIGDGDLIERLRVRRADINALIGVRGYNETNLRRSLTEYSDGLNTSLPADQERFNAEGRGSASIMDSETIEMLSYWGNVQGWTLLEYGMTQDQIPDPDIDYPIHAQIIGNYVVKAVKNITGIIPYSKCVYTQIPGSFWGNGLPDELEDLQLIVNALARAIANNAAMASGPQVEVNIEKMRVGSDCNTLVPWKIWQTDNEGMQSNTPVVRFYQPKSIINELMGVYEKFSAEADVKTGIPSIAHGGTKMGSGAGNALANYEKVLTPQGAVAISSLNVGDLVVNTYGSFSKVTGVYPQGESDIFRVKFSNGESVDCDANHRWSVRTHHDRKFKTLTTQEIINKGLFRKTRMDWRNPKGFRPKWMLPMIDLVEFNERPVKVDPYTMGALIGDGDARCRVTNMDEEVFSRIPYPLGKPDKTSNGRAWTQAVVGIKKDYLSYGLQCKSINKFIPEDYLFNSKEVRLELLRGLMDTDGCCSKQGETFLSTSSYRLALDFIKLVRSLGGAVNGIHEAEAGYFEIKGRRCFRQKNYRVAFNLPHQEIFGLPRKQERVSFKPKTHTYITGIEYIGKSLATCISVDSKDSLFVCENFIPTHNTASGLSMYLEMAGKVIRELISRIDMNIVYPTITRSYYFNMMFDSDMSIKGDAKVLVRGVNAMSMQEQQALRKQEFLNTTNNPNDMQIMGLEGRRYILREAARILDMDVDKAVPLDRNLALLQEQLDKVVISPPEGNTESTDNTTTDVAGNPAGGTDVNMFNSVSQKGGQV